MEICTLCFLCGFVLTASLGSYFSNAIFSALKQQNFTQETFMLNNFHKTFNFSHALEKGVLQLAKHILQCLPSTIQIGVALVTKPVMNACQKTKVTLVLY